ncbi:MAG: bifunctional oligoribonuclease/PAP phosphatase NrnA [Clostridia bacterium]|nr:bifunctional oligoribonuclease/PAP phosphatase NrnA [Clostridia bacterium]
MTLDEILKQIQNAESIVIVAHESPDGDAIGSSLAMKLALEELGKKPDVIVPEVPEVYDFLPGREDIKSESDVKQYELAISVDCATEMRIAGRQYFENAKHTIVIDHHGSNTMYGDFNYVNPVSPACCDILAGIFDYYNINITKDIGTCLLTGIITDTGGFKYPATTAETFEFAAELLRKGVNVSDIYKRTMDTVTRANFELTKRVMDRMEILEDGKVTFTYITKKDEDEVGAKPGDHEGLVNIGRNLIGVEVSVFIRQKEDGIDQYKISMRTNGDVNASDICLMFGGGGHPRAAGATIDGTVEEVKEKIMKQIKKVL